MFKHLYPLYLFSFFILILPSCHQQHSTVPGPAEEDKFPSEYMFRQRAWPLGYVDRDAYKTGMMQAAEKKREAAFFRDNQVWESAGPTNVGGRITSLAATPDGQTIYAGAASGGIWKTTDDGLNWTPVFDDAPTLSIGDLAVAPSEPQTIYAGTGEPNAGGGSLAYDGLGVFKSTDGGTNWQLAGLTDAGSIGKVVVHPNNADKVFIAAMGFLFANNPERGVFRTTDGGQNWEKVLFVNDSTGAIDLALHPTNPDIVYAATWERIRRPDRRQYGGPGSGIWRSMDGGDTWEELFGGLPQSDNGRIGLAVTPAQPDLVMALYESESGFSKGVYQSADKGDAWQLLGGLDITYPGYGWWFGKIFLDPTDAGKVFALGLDVHRSIDGASSFDNITENSNVHVDQHALYIDPSNPDRIILGNDGGIYVSYNGTTTWEFRSNIPITQFYTCEIDASLPHRLYGGTQDNGTWRTLSGGVGDYENIIGGDGFHVVVNSANNNFILGESQYGGLVSSSDGGDNFSWIANQITSRKNWNMPIVADPNVPFTVYVGSERVFKTENHGSSWSPISPDLSNGDTGGNLIYATITSIAVSPLNSQIIWAGTDDGNVWVTNDGGTNWNKKTDGLPERWVTRVVADPFLEETAYVTFSGYRYNDYLPHVFRTPNLGGGWEDISGDLPEVPVNDLIVDPSGPSSYVVATDAGVYITRDFGEKWEILADGLPAVPVTDLELHAETRTLIAATYGRSLYRTEWEELPLSTRPDSNPGISLVIAPNPITDNSSIILTLTESREIQVGIYDLQGKKVAGIFKGKALSGKSNFDFNRSQFPTAGQYFVRVSGEGILEVKKFVVI